MVNTSCDLTLATCSLTSEQQYSDLTSGSQHCTPAMLHKAFHEKPTCFLEVDKTYLDIFDILLEFVENMLESKNFVFDYMARMKTALGIL